MEENHTSHDSLIQNWLELHCLKGENLVLSLRSFGTCVVVFEDHVYFVHPSTDISVDIGTAEKPLHMRSKFRFVFPPFHFQNGGRRINNQHVIVMALGNILLAQSIYKQLGYFGQSLVQMFWLWSRGSKRCFQFYQAIKTALPGGNFQLFQIHARYRFSLL